MQLYLPNDEVRNIPLTRIEEQSILLNIADSETATVISGEFVDTDLDMALLFLPSESFFLQAFVITKDISLIELGQQLDSLQTEISEIKQSLDELKESLPILNQILFFLFD